MNPEITIHNVKTGETIVREMTDDEVATQVLEMEALAEAVAAAEAAIPQATIGGVEVRLSRPVFEAIREQAMSAVALGETNVTFAYGEGTVTGTLTEARAAMRTFLG